MVILGVLIIGVVSTLWIGTLCLIRSELEVVYGLDD